jgi:hypothetical protein
VHVFVGTRPDFIATSVNISELGIALTNSPALQVGETVVLRLTLPDPEVSAKISAEVCWRDEAGSAGLQFVGVPVQIKEQLTAWLTVRLDQSLRQEAVVRA